MNLENRYHEPLFPISTAAKLLSVSVQTLRLYEKEGLILPFKKSSKHRLYSKQILKELNVSGEQLRKRR